MLLYGLESVPMTESRERAIDASHRSLARYALGIHHPDALTTVELYAKPPMTRLSSVLRQRRLMLVGHALRDDKRRIASDEPRTPLALTLTHSPIEPYRRGMGNMVTLRQTFTEDLQAIGLVVSNVHTNKHTGAVFSHCRIF